MESEVRLHEQRVKDAEKLESTAHRQQQQLEKELIDLKRKRAESQVTLGNYKTSLQKMYVLHVLHCMVFNVVHWMFNISSLGQNSCTDTEHKQQ